MNWIHKLKLSHLRLFIVLAETGSLSETARLQHSTQPGLSRWLRDLEDDLGEALFERHARGLVLTLFGDYFLECARRLVNEADKTERGMAALQAGHGGLIRLGVSPAAASCFVPAAMIQFLQYYPEARLEICENTMDVLLQKLGERMLDVVIGRLDNYRPSSQLFSEVLYYEPLQVIARPEHPLAGQVVSWEELHQFDWIVWPEGTPIRDKFDGAIVNAGWKVPNYLIESSSLSVTLYLLQNSDMLTVASDKIARNYFRQNLVTLLGFDLDQVAGQLGMCWRDEPYIDRTTLTLLDCLRRTAREDSHF